LTMLRRIQDFAKVRILQRFFFDRCVKSFHKHLTVLLRDSFA
jgi:hypothetical protein